MMAKVTRNLNRAALVRASGDAIRRGSKSFHMASRLFDRATRERAWLLYSWCRHCDDECDGQSLGFASPGDRKAQVGRVEELTWMALRGEAVGEAPFDALAAVFEETPIPIRFISDHLRGFAMDAEGWRPRSEADLLAYCYHVAGAVGCMMAVIMGIDPDDEASLRAASDLGTAFQLSNIARDVRDDQANGRCYIPADWLKKAGLTEQDLADRVEAFVPLVKRITDLAARYERSAHAGVPNLPFRARWAVLAALRIYGAIGRQVAALGPRAWDQRVILSRRQKMAFLAPSLVAAATARRRS